MDPEIEDLMNLRHMLGAEPGRYPPNLWGFRNRFCSGEKDMPSMLRLVAKGWVRQGRTTELTGGAPTFHATEAGCRAVGMSADRIAAVIGGDPR